jgi:hypothetical protein
LPTQWATTEAARRGGQRARIKNYPLNNLLKETELKAADWKHCRAKGSSPKKAQRLEKGKTLTLCSNLEVAEGEDVQVDEGVDG